jgi:uncharacterized protein YbjT (DUF2867 family)
MTHVSGPPARSLTVLVAGATGRFGRISDALIARGHHVVAVTRDPSSTAAKRLAELGADVATGDFDDPEGLAALMARVDGVFATGTMHRSGSDGERRHGTNIADAANAAGVGHLVWVSAAGAVPRVRVPLLEVKADAEEHLDSLDVVSTVVAPVYFMENLFNPWNLASLQAGKVPTFMPATRTLQQVPIVDIVAFAVLALEQRDRFAGRRIEIGSDQLSAEQMAQSLTRIVGRQFVTDQRDPGELGPGMAALFEWLDAGGQAVDIDEVRRTHPDVGWHSFEQWAALQRWG